MSTHDESRPREDRPEQRATDALAPDDARFVARVADAYAPPEPSAADRARFRARLEEKLARRNRAPSWRWLAPAALAAVAALLVTTQLRVGDVAPGQVVSVTNRAASDAQEETLLALVTGEAASDDASLPEDYQAIASLMY
jgi:hypothetical protein